MALAGNAAGTVAGGRGSCDSSAGGAVGLNLIAGTPAALLLAGVFLVGVLLVGVAVTTPVAVAGSRMGNVLVPELLDLSGASFAVGAASTMRIGGSAAALSLPVVNDGEAASAPGWGVISVRTVPLSEGRELAAGTSMIGTVVEEFVEEMVGVAGGGV
jgi:hypothetical protein